MLELQKVTYIPMPEINDMINEVQAQVVYAILGEIVNIYELPDKYTIGFYGTDGQRKIIQSVINMTMKEIEIANMDNTLKFLFDNGLYIPNNNKIITDLKTV